MTTIATNLQTTRYSKDKIATEYDVTWLEPVFDFSEGLLAPYSGIIAGLAGEESPDIASQLIGATGYAATTGGNTDAYGKLGYDIQQNPYYYAGNIFSEGLLFIGTLGGSFAIKGATVGAKAGAIGAKAGTKSVLDDVLRVGTKSDDVAKSAVTPIAKTADDAAKLVSKPAAKTAGKGAGRAAGAGLGGAAIGAAAAIIPPIITGAAGLLLLLIAIAADR